MKNPSRDFVDPQRNIPIKYIPVSRLDRIFGDFFPGIFKSIPTIEETNGKGQKIILFKTFMGPFWGRENDKASLEYVTKEQFLARYQQDPVSIKPGDIVFDIGGHLGAFTRIALLRGASKIIVFEPEKMNIFLFKKTFSEEIQSGKILLIEKAAWEQEGNLEFIGDGIDFRIANIEEETELSKIRVPATTIDRISKEYKLQVDFIKMDIEGSERHALLGAEIVLKKYKPRMAICVYHLPDDPVVIPKLISQINPSYRRFRDNSFTKGVFFFH